MNESRRRNARSRLLLFGTLLAAAMTLVLPASVGAVAGAAFTTDNPAATEECLHGASGDGSAVNCNHYGAKEDVWINGGPSSGQNHLSSGTYFFTVLSPGGQPDPNDGGAKNLSDTSAAPWTGGDVNDDGSAVGSGDAVTNRVFTVDDSGHADNYVGSHQTYDAGPLGTLIQLIPYDDTVNAGGVYILAICQISTDQLTLPVTSVSSVDPSDCKYDAFKVRTGGDTTPPASDLSVIKTVDEAFDRSFDWDIQKDANATSVNTTALTHTFNYTVKVWLESATDSGWAVTGTISVFNPNDFAVTLTDLTDSIDDTNASCTLVDENGDPIASGAGLVVPGSSGGPLGQLDVDYLCTYSAAPANADAVNTATATWDNSGDMEGTTGSADWNEDVDFGDVAPDLIDECINVTDAFNGGAAAALGSVCVDDNGDEDSHTTASGVTFEEALDGSFLFKYSRTVNVPRNGCQTYNNLAAFTADSGQNDNDPASVTVCGPITGGFTLGFWSNKNGEDAMKGCTGGMTGTLAYLSSLNLVNKNGTAFNPTSYTQFKSWLLGGDATNMSYMLSLQMAATALDVRCKGMGTLGGIAGNACVAHPLTGGPISINALIAEANTFLASNLNTSTAGTARTTAEKYKILFDGLNNNLVFAVSCS